MYFRAWFLNFSGIERWNWSSRISQGTRKLNRIPNYIVKEKQFLIEALPKKLVLSAESSWSSRVAL